MMQAQTVVSSTTLSECIALLVAHGEADTAALFSLARRVGFSDIRDAAQPGSMRLDHDRTVYVLVHYDVSNDAKSKLLSTLRKVEEPNIRFAPVVLFLPDGPFDQLLEYIEMGFDDVICLPEKSHVLSARLEKQIGVEHLYIETETYRGPDRRRMDIAGQAHPRRTGDSDHTKITLKRTPYGVQILKRQLFIKGRTAEQHRAK